MIERLLRLVVGIVLVALAGLGRALGHPPRRLRLAPRRLERERSSRSAPTSPSRRSTDTALKDPDNPTKVFRVDMAQRRARLPAQPRPAREPHPRQHPRAQPGGGGPALRPPHRRPDPRRPLPRRPLLLPRRDAPPAARGDPRRPRGPRRRREDRDRRGRRPRALEGQDVLPRQARAQELRRGLRRALRPDRRPRRAGAGHRPARGLAQATSCPPPTSGCCSRPSSTAARACSTAAASSSSSTTPTTTTCPATRSTPTRWSAATACSIRDEIRMIRPGFYLGRAYANKVFLLNFMLYNAEVADAGKDGFASGDEVAEDCWPGEQQRAAADVSRCARLGGRRRARHGAGARRPAAAPTLPPPARSLLSRALPRGPAPSPSRPSSTACAPSPAPRTSRPPSSPSAARCSATPPTPTTSPPPASSSPSPATAPPAPATPASPTASSSATSPPPR